MSEKTEELKELWQTAMYREVAANAFYTAGIEKTDDPGAKALLKDLAAAETSHYVLLEKYRERGKIRKSRQQVKDLMQSEYLASGGTTLEGAGLQDTLLYAIKREQESIDFYSRMTGIMTAIEGKELCERLTTEELKHKVRIELLYERLFLKEG